MPMVDMKDVYVCMNDYICAHTHANTYVTVCILNQRVALQFPQPRPSLASLPSPFLTVFLRQLVEQQ